jgi:transposase
MGRKSKVLKLSSTERAELEQGFKNKKSVILSKRCHIILLKSDGRSSEEIAHILGITIQPVNKWVKNYEQRGIQGLETKPGQGRKPILNKEKDSAKIKAAIKNERQRLKLAKADLEKELGKEFSLKTLKRFLKNLSVDGNASA